MNEVNRVVVSFVTGDIQAALIIDSYTQLNEEIDLHLHVKGEKYGTIISGKGQGLREKFLNYINQQPDGTVIELTVDHS